MGFPRSERNREFGLIPNNSPLCRSTDPDPESGSLEPSIDLICATCGIEPEIVAASTLVSHNPDQGLRVARVPHLIAMKVLSESESRQQDRIDLHALLVVATDVEIERARQASSLIRERDFDRGKDLQAGLEGFLETAGRADLK